MPETLLQTKLYIPPLRPNLVPRTRLIERLNQGLQLGHRLTLISAPAGFGKTTVVSEWLGNIRSEIAKESQMVNRIAWLSLDESDNDPARFLSYVIAALNQAEGIETTIGKGALDMLQAPQPPAAESILTALLNEITNFPDNFLLVLDDYHVISAQSIDASTSVDGALTFLLEHLPPQMHLVIATREDPDLPLARLRVRGQLTELRAADLRFSSSEAAEFLNQVMGLGLSAENIVTLESRTEGWIAGLQLAAISMQGHKDAADFIKSFTGSHHFVLDYLIEEVLEGQSESVQNFLLQTAVLDRMTGSLCDAVCSVGTDTDQENGQVTLEMLEHANLFIVPLDEERRWYRYHHLFADLLRRRLRQTQSDRALSLHHRASEWYEQNSFTNEAIEHAFRAEDIERAAHLIEKHVDTLWQRGQHAKLRRWLARLPVELVFSKPHLCILQAWDLFASGQQEAAEQSLQAAEKALVTNGDPGTRTSPVELDQTTGLDRMKIQGRVAAIRAFLAFYRGDVEEINHYAHHALEYLPEEDLTWRSTAIVALGDACSFIGELTTAYQVRIEALEASKAAGNIYMTLIAGMKLAITMRELGKLQRVIEICQQQLQLANESGLSQTAVVGWLLAIWGEVLAELNDLDGAAHHAKKGAELTERGRDLGMIGWSNLCLARVFFSRGDMAGAEEIVQKMENIARDSSVPPWISNLMTARQARIWLAEDKLETVSDWVDERGLEADEEPKYLHETEYIVLARFLIAQGRLDEATTHLQRLLEATEAGGRTSRVIEILILQALASQAGGDSVRAMTKVERALTLGEPEGFVRIFVDEGSPMARLLQAALNQGVAPKYIRRILAAFSSDVPVQVDTASSQTDQSKLIEPLSERELEVLQLIAEGLTNQAIASRLFLSRNTVKVHARNINGKLGVHSRTQAVAKARALGILPGN